MSKSSERGEREGEGGGVHTGESDKGRMYVHVHVHVGESNTSHWGLVGEEHRGHPDGSMPLSLLVCSSWW